MGKLIYRVCLAVVLLLVVAGGIYYYTTISGRGQSPEQGTFVDRNVDSIQKAEMVDFLKYQSERM